MQIVRLIILLVTIVIIVSCNNDDAAKRVIKADKGTVHNSYEDTGNIDFNSCYENFFKGLPRFRDSSIAYLVWKNKERKRLTQFFKDEFMGTVSQYGKKDLDGDGTMELIIFNYTGGAHCCDEYYIFSEKKEQEFEYKAHITGGQACIDATSNRISYSLSETLGYFFSCFACGMADTTGVFKTLREIQLKYAGSTLQVVTYDSLLAKQNISNLEVLKKNGFEKITGLMDNGWRKEFAINIAIWHYNHGKNWKLTKLLFDKYYTFKDSPKVWKEFYRTMSEAAKENDF